MFVFCTFLSFGFKDHLKFENVTILTNINVDNLNGIDMHTIIPLHTDQVIDSTLNLGFVSIEKDLHVGKLINKHNLTEEYENTVSQNTDQVISSKLIFVNPITILHNLKTSGLINGQDLERLVTIDTEQNLTASYVFNGKVTIDSNLTVLGRVNNINLGDWQLRTVTASGSQEQNINDLWHVNGDVSFREDVIGKGRLCGIDVRKMANEVVRKQSVKFQVENVIKNDYLNICSNVQDLIKIGKSRPFLFKYLEYYNTLNLEHYILAVHHFQYETRNYLIVSQKQSCYSLLYEWKSNNFNYIGNLQTGEVEQFVTVHTAEKVFLVTKNNNETKCLNMGVNIWVFGGNTLTHIYGLKHSVLLQKSKIPGTFYSLDEESILEYKIFYEDESATINEYKHDLKYGTSFRSESYYNSILTTQESAEFDYDVPTIIENANLGMKRYLPKTNVREIMVFDAGPLGDLLRLTAVAIWEEATIRSQADEIKIYEDFENGKLYDKIATYRPSNLNILDFSKTGGETFLAFLENNEILKIYEYKAFKGFIHRQSVGFAASKMITITLPLFPYFGKRKFLVLGNENHLSLLEAVMDGDRPSENFYCEK